MEVDNPGLEQEDDEKFGDEEGDDDDDDDEEMGDELDEDDDDFDDDYDLDDTDAELDGISESELEEMAASTARQLMMVQMQVAAQSGRDEEQQNQRSSTTSTTTMTQVESHINSPQEKWQDFLNALCSSKVFKIMNVDCNNLQLATAQSPALILNQLVAAILSHDKRPLTHVILEGDFLNFLWKKNNNNNQSTGHQQQQQQRHLFQALFGTTKHYDSLTYIRLGGGTGAGTGEGGVLDLNSLLAVLKTPPPPPSSPNFLSLTELELGPPLVLFLQDAEHDPVTSLQAILIRAKNLKQIHLLGISIAPQLQQQQQQKLGLLDPLLATVSTLASLDVCRLVGAVPSSVPLITAANLDQVLQRKPKWWRLALDGMGLNDDAAHVLAQHMAKSDQCKAGDLLSLERNPDITVQGWNRLFSVLYQKQRMGLVKVDDPNQQANFDLVRSMNNLHGRLGYISSVGPLSSNTTPVHGNKVTPLGKADDVILATSYPSRQQWVEWLAKLSQISWEDEKHKLNYLWFSILERPDFVYCETVSL